MKFPLGAMSVGDILDRGQKLLLARFPLVQTLNEHLSFSEDADA